MLAFQNFDQWWLWLLALAWLAAAWLMWRRDTGSQRRLEALFGSIMSRRLTASLHVGRRRWRSVLVLLALFFAWMAAARPQWGRRAEPIPQEARDIALVFDVSRNEPGEHTGIEGLEAARNVAGNLLEQRTLDRFAVVAFAGEAFLECPLTWDREILLNLIEALSSQTIPVPGSNPAAGLREGRRALDGAVGEHRAIILFSSDKVVRNDDLDREVGFLREERIPVFTVSFDLPPSFAPDQPGGPTLAADDREDLSDPRQPRRALTALAVATGGFHVNIDQIELRAEERLADAIADLTPRQYAREREAEQPAERFQWPLALAVFLLLITFFIDQRRAVPGTSGRTGAWPLVGALTLTMTLGTGASRAEEQVPATYRLILRPGLEALSLHLELQRWQKQLEDSPSLEQQAVIYYNLGRVQQMLGALAQARNAYRMALSRFGEDDLLRAHSLWNLGTVEHLLARRAMAEAPVEAKQLLVAARNRYREAMRVLGGAPGLARNYQVLAREHALLELVLAGRSQIEAARQAARVETEDLAKTPLDMPPPPSDPEGVDQADPPALEAPRWMPMAGLEDGEETAWNGIGFPPPDFVHEPAPAETPAHGEEAYPEEDLTPARVESIMESVRERQGNFRQFLKEQRFGRD